MQSVIKLTVFNLKADLCRDCSRQSSAFPPSMEVIGTQKTVA